MGWGANVSIAERAHVVPVLTLMHVCRLQFRDIVLRVNQKRQQREGSNLVVQIQRQVGALCPTT